MRSFAVQTAVLCLLAAGAVGQQVSDDSRGRPRVALLIGNSAYAWSRLHSPAEDAEAVGEALERAGFSVEVGLNLSRAEMEAALDAFVSRAVGSEAALVYYSGHGVQIEGQVYFLPVDMTREDVGAIKYGTHSAALLSARLAAAGAQLDIIIADTCREDAGTELIPGGFVSHGQEKLRAAERAGSCIVYSTYAGGRSREGPPEGRSIFTESFVREMQVPGRTLYDICLEASRRMREEGLWGQQPVVCLTGAAGEFRFFIEDESRIENPSSKDH